SLNDNPTRAICTLHRSDPRRPGVLLRRYDTTEALEKLIDFVDERSLPANRGIDGFRDLYQRQHFPGLGKVKELSIMNHMLVMEDAII
ncbi:hypothetical protein ACF07R_02180, partial [Brevibacterium casei]